MAGAPPLYYDPVAAPCFIDWLGASKVGRTCVCGHVKRLLASKWSGVSESWAPSSELIAGCLTIDVRQPCGPIILRILRAEKLITTEHLFSNARQQQPKVLVGFAVISKKRWLVQWSAIQLVACQSSSSVLVRKESMTSPISNVRLTDHKAAPDSPWHKVFAR